MKLLKLTVILFLLGASSLAVANEDTYLFDMKIFDISDVADGVNNYQQLEPVDNPKILTKEGIPAYMKVMGEDDKTLRFELELLVKDEETYNLKYELFKDEEMVSGSINTEKYSLDKPWQLVTKFDGKILLLVVNVSKSDFVEQTNKEPDSL